MYVFVYIGMSVRVYIPSDMRLFVRFVLFWSCPVCHYFTTAAMEKQKSRMLPREL